MIRTEQLYYLVQVSQYNSITTVAKELYMTKSAISTAIKNLETECGFAILERSYRGVKFTKKGEIVLEYAKEVLQTLKEIEKLKLLPDVDSLSEASKVKLFVDSRLMVLLQKRIIEYGRELFSYYNIIEIENILDKLELVDDMTVAITIVDDTIINNLQEDGWGVKVLYKSCLYPVSKKNTKLISRNKTKLDLFEIRALPKILFMPQTYLLHEELTENVLLKSQNNNLCIDAILNDYGIGFMTDFSNTISVEKRKLLKTYEPLNETMLSIILLMKNTEAMDRMRLIEYVLSN